MVVGLAEKTDGSPCSSPIPSPQNPLSETFRPTLRPTLRPVRSPRSNRQNARGVLRANSDAPGSTDHTPSLQSFPATPGPEARIGLTELQRGEHEASAEQPKRLRAEEIQSAFNTE